MTCESCNQARDNPQWRQFNPACLYCGARILQCLGTLDIAVSECRQRRRESLAVWLQHGHNEQEIRAMVKGPLAIGPASSQASDRPSETRHRSRKQKSRTPS